ncbi:polyprotein of retroviral, partial [Lasius niger]
NVSQEIDFEEKTELVYDNVYSVEFNEPKRPIEISEVKIDSNIGFEHEKQLLELLNNYRDCFALNIAELGCTELIKMDIKEKEGSKPVCMKPYRTNAQERVDIANIVKEWKQNGIVSETRSPYASPVMLVKKKTGENRLVVDYRRLNSQTIKDKFPLPRIDDLLERLQDCELFTTLDLAHGYLQIPLTEEAKLKTAFITADETGQFERMIFGLANAPAEFQRLMYRALGTLVNKDVLCYLDDILIPAKNWEEMMTKLTKVFEALRLANLTLKLARCEFAKK